MTDGRIMLNGELQNTLRKQERLFQPKADMLGVTAILKVATDGSIIDIVSKYSYLIIVSKVQIKNAGIHLSFC